MADKESKSPMRKVLELKIQREKGYLYFIESKGDGHLYRKGRGSPELVAELNFPRQPGVIYFLDSQGDISSMGAPTDGSSMTTSGSPFIRGPVKESYPLTDVPWADKRADRIEAVFGKPKSVMHIPFPYALSRGVPPIHVWVWPDSPRNGLTLLMTEGLSDVALHDDDGEDVPYAVELLTVSSDPNWAANALRIAGESIVGAYDRLFMGIGETMSLCNPPEPLAPGSALTRLAFLVPPSPVLAASESLMDFEIRNRKLLPLWCVGISEEERELLHELDDEEFAARIENEVFDFEPRRRTLRRLS